jgi:hypothetical protein
MLLYLFIINIVGDFVAYSTYIMARTGTGTGTSYLLQ